jgi:hypothetical protein
MGIRTCRRNVLMACCGAALLYVHHLKLVGTQPGGCGAGEFFDGHGRSCKSCSVCALGQVTIQDCTPTVDTLCSHCTVGKEFWLMATGKCQACSACPAGMTTMSLCSGLEDTSCTHEAGTGFHDMAHEVPEQPTDVKVGRGGEATVVVRKLQRRTIPSHPSACPGHLVGTSVPSRLNKGPCLLIFAAHTPYNASSRPAPHVVEGQLGS